EERERNQASSGIGEKIDSLIHNIDALQVSFPIFMVLSGGIVIACSRERDDFVKKNAVADGATPPNFRLGAEHILEMNRFTARLNKAVAGIGLLPQTFVVALVSQYDAFLGSLLRCVYRARPELLEKSAKQLSYAELCKFGDLE